MNFKIERTAADRLSSVEYRFHISTSAGNNRLTIFLTDWITMSRPSTRHKFQITDHWKNNQGYKPPRPKPEVPADVRNELRLKIIADIDASFEQ